MPNQVVVFHMTGCGPCEEYVPRFKKIAAAYKSRLAIRSANIARADKALSDAALKFRIEATPTTLVIDAQDKAIKRKVGALSNKEIIALLEFACRP